MDHGDARGLQWDESVEWNKSMLVGISLKGNKAYGVYLILYSLALETLKFTRVPSFILLV